MDIAGADGVSLLELFVTYLAVGSAFAMRGYFLNRRRPFGAAARVVLTQFFLWLPIWLFRLTRRATPFRRPGSPASGVDRKIEAQIEHILSSVRGIRVRNQVREALERYTALHMALVHERGQATGQFELFTISGNGNGNTGTTCLYRKNLSKLRIHKTRTADDLVRMICHDSSLNSLGSQLTAFFGAFGDLDSIAKLEAIRIEKNSADSIQIRMAA